MKSGTQEVVRSRGAGQLATASQRRDSVQLEIDRLLDCIIPDTKEEIGKRIRRLSEERSEHDIEIARMEKIQTTAVDVDAAAAEIASQISAFSSIFEEGTIEEKKEFISLFVEKVVVNSKKGSVRVHIRQFPAPENLDTGNASFQMVAGTRCEHQKTPFPPVDVVEVAFVRKGSVLVPVAA